MASDDEETWVLGNPGTPEAADYWQRRAERAARCDSLLAELKVATTLKPGITEFGHLQVILNVPHGTGRHRDDGYDELSGPDPEDDDMLEGL